MPVPISAAQLRLRVLIVDEVLGLDGHVDHLCCAAELEVAIWAMFISWSGI